jgi:hypothetical protein
MPVRHSCFISYSSGSTAEYSAIIDRLEAKLKEKLEFYLDEPPWRYTTSQSVGAAYREAIPVALCQSVCMVVLYVPKYEVRKTCVQEFVAMEDIEKARLGRIQPPLGPDYRMIIPIILKKRHGGKLPAWIEESRNYLDLTEYVTLATPLVKALDDPRCEQRLEEIAAAIGALHAAIVSTQPDLCTGCSPELPEDERVLERWIAQEKYVLPTRQPVP